MKDSKGKAKSNSAGFILAGVLVLLVLVAAYMILFYKPAAEGAKGTASLVYLENCKYDPVAEMIVCDTNCIGSPGDGTSFVVLDKDENISMALDSSVKIGTIAFSDGKVFAKMEANGMLGSVRLSGLDQDTSRWIVSLMCKNPEGSGASFGAVKV